MITMWMALLFVATWGITVGLLAPQALVPEVFFVGLVAVAVSLVASWFS